MNPITVRAILRILSDPDRRKKDDELQRFYHVLLDIAPDGKGNIDARKLGNKFQKFQERIIDGYCLKKAGAFGHTAKWQVIKMGVFN